IAPYGVGPCTYKSFLVLYKELQQLGFKLFLLTGRDETYGNATETNLQSAGYTSWERLILRGSPNAGKPAIVYKSWARKELEAEGYRIHGSSGDQWSDLLGFAAATRSFKLPNPMYYTA
ncbi:acid phosphatase 1-like, partial [Cornus florida]|uniref:acid phosphatase 1-like n=1 Tax=Cornus florida TaxID=4283 RepID=UPI0028994D17